MKQHRYLLAQMILSLIALALLCIGCSKDESVKPSYKITEHEIKVVIEGDTDRVMKDIIIRGSHIDFEESTKVENFERVFKVRDTDTDLEVMVMSEEWFNLSITIFADGELVAADPEKIKLEPTDLWYTI